MKLGVERELPALYCLRAGPRAISTGIGTILQYSRRAVNVEFPGRVVTLLNRASSLTPSSISLDTESIPRFNHARFEGSNLLTDTFFTELRNLAEMHFTRKATTSPEEVLESVMPYLQPLSGSISSAYLHLHGHPLRSTGVENTINKKQAEILKSSESLDELARGLLGLGIGLTPSGDDFILGVIAGLNIMGAPTAPLLGPIREYDYPFSRTLLLDSIEGYYSEPLLAFLEDIVDGSLTNEHAEALLNTGHSSGHDTLAGFGYAMELQLHGGVMQSLFDDLRGLIS
jgi:hypothetical protein